VKRNGAAVVGVGFIVDRSNGKKLFEESVFSVFQMNVVTYEAEKCPLCKDNLPVVKPGSRSMH
jgi:orotate phosphoribosyltransferase